MASSIAILDDPGYESIPPEPLSGVRMRPLAPSFSGLADALAADDDGPESHAAASRIRLDGLAATPTPAVPDTVRAQEQAIRHLRAAASMLAKTDSSMRYTVEAALVVAEIELSRMRGLP